MRDTAALVGERIKRAREAAGVTQTGLAKALSKQQTAVSHWETGRRLPGLDDLVAIARALDTSPSELLPETSQRRSGPVLLRSVMDTLQTDQLRGQVEAFIESAEDLPVLPRRIVVPADRPARAGQALLRNAAKLGVDVAVGGLPLDIEQLAELCGVRVVLKRFEDGLSGLLVILDDGPAMGINKVHTEGRRRFTIAHELGHFLLGHYDRFHLDLPSAEAGESPYYDWRLEREANQFAADVLMPTGLVEQCSARGMNSRELADKFGVSEVAMGYRLINLGLATP